MPNGPSSSKRSKRCAMARKAIRRGAGYPSRPAGRIAQRNSLRQERLEICESGGEPFPCKLRVDMAVLGVRGLPNSVVNTDQNRELQMRVLDVRHHEYRVHLVVPGGGVPVDVGNIQGFDVRSH